MDDSDESRIWLEGSGSEEEEAADEEEIDADDESLSRALPKSSGRLVLKDLDFRVKPGERVALVGPSGSGKTTLVSLLPRLYDVVSGRILIDGIDIRDYKLRTLREAIAVVQQDSFVFSGTIRENLCYGRPKACEDDMIAAAKAANAHDFISALPAKYDTVLGERGVNLSGGQRQRLSIARALLKNPSILILDEATSALDSESEALVQSALDHLMQGRTSFIIAHRLSTVRGADRILVLRDGVIAEQGSHDALMAHDGLYARLVRQQFGPGPALVVPMPPVAPPTQAVAPVAAVGAAPVTLTQPSSVPADLTPVRQAS